MSVCIAQHLIMQIKVIKKKKKNDQHQNWPPIVVNVNHAMLIKVRLIGASGLVSSRVKNMAAHVLDDGNSLLFNAE